MSTDTAPVPGATVWLTGLPKRRARPRSPRRWRTVLRAEGRAVEVLDGDAVRAVLSPELGYSRADRDANVARIGWVAGRLAGHGVSCWPRSCRPSRPPVMPYAPSTRPARCRSSKCTSRRRCRVCADATSRPLRPQRDGALAGLTGTGGPGGEYEPPSTPDLRLDNQWPLYRRRRRRAVCPAAQGELA